MGLTFTVKSQQLTLIVKVKLEFRGKIDKTDITMTIGMSILVGIDYNVDEGYF